MKRINNTRHSKNSQSTQEINITPMLDVVFILLIFFIVTASFVKEKGVNINKAAAAAQPTENKTALIKLSTDLITVNQTNTSIDGIESLLALLKAEQPELKVLISSAAEVRTEQLVQVIDQINKAGITEYTLKAY